MSEEIDAVIYWVDGDDPNWKKEYELYKGKPSGRFRDLGVLKFVLRGIEYNLPWIRHIHFVTNGQRPSWLKDNPRLKFHTHKDIFIYKDALPVFNSSSIEANFFNIPGLSEKFILFNDDMLVLDYLPPERFFVKGKPVDYIKLSFPRRGKIYEIIKPQNLNAVKFINNAYNYLCVKDIMKHRFSSLFSRSYSLRINLNNLVYSFLYRVYWYEVYHHPQAHLKSTWIKFFSMNEGVVKRTIFSKFRSGNDINQYLFRYINLSNGDFHPASFNDHLSVYVKDAICFKRNKDIYLGKKLLCICEDERMSDSNFSELKRELVESLVFKLPNKSSFEL